MILDDKQALEAVERVANAIALTYRDYFETLTVHIRELQLDEVLKAMGYHLDECYQIDLNDPRGTEEEDIFV